MRDDQTLSDGEPWDQGDERLRRFFRAAPADAADDGFAREIMQRIERLRQRRRLVLGAAVLAGAAVAVPQLLPGLEVLVGGLAGLVRGLETAPTGIAANVVALCAFATAVW